MTELTPEEIAAGNRVIAEFMGYEIFADYCLFISPNISTTIQAWAKYHSSFDWLIPACRKFSALMIPTFAYSNKVAAIHAKTIEYEILPLWKELVSAINWYNSINEAKL